MMAPVRSRAAALVMVVLLVSLTLSGCGEDHLQTAAMLTGGHPERGRVLVKQYGCHTCHSIPGVRGADGVAGPPLDRIAVRNFIGGGHINTPENLIQYVRAPQSMNPNSGMPDTGVSEPDARHIAAYLYTLR